MPSSRRRSQLSLWLRVVAAGLVLTAVTVTLVVFETAALGVVVYWTLRVLLDLAQGVSLSPAVALPSAVATVVGLAAVVLAVHRVDRDHDGGYVDQLADLFLGAVRLTAGAALLAGSVGLAVLVTRPIQLPRWTLVLGAVVLVAALLPVAAIALARDVDGLPWAIEELETDDERPGAEKPWREGSVGRQIADWLVEAVATNAAALEVAAEAVVDELRAVVAATRRRLGPVGSALVGAVCLSALVGTSLVGQRRPTTAVLWPLSAALGATFALGHVGGAVRRQLRDEGLVDGLVGSLGEPVEGDPRPAVEARVTRLAAALDVPAPTVDVRQSDAPTAAVVGVQPADSTLVVSTGLVEIISEDELDAVLAHELAHVANRDAAVVTALSVPRATAEAVFYRYGANPIAALLAAVVAATSRLCVAIVSRAREDAADDAAVDATGDPAALVGALERLDDRRGPPSEDFRAVAAPFSIVPPPWEEHRFFDRTRRFLFRRLLGTHPPTYRRIERLRARVEQR